jgi:hypothetical protein
MGRKLVIDGSLNPKITKLLIAKQATGFNGGFQFVVGVFGQPI